MYFPDLNFEELVAYGYLEYKRKANFPLEKFDGTGCLAVDTLGMEKAKFRFAKLLQEMKRKLWKYVGK